MALSLNKARLDNLADEIWKSAERLRGKFKPYEYQNVILPIIVIRRLIRSVACPLELVTSSAASAFI